VFTTRSSWQLSLLFLALTIKDSFLTILNVFESTKK
jgi:hypothetical protein